MGLRRQEWVEIVRQERGQVDWTPTRHTRICSTHFRDEDKYVAAGDRVYISKTALPVIGDNSLEEASQFRFIYFKMLLQSLCIYLHPFV